MWWFLGLAGLALGLWAVFSARRVLYPERQVLPAPDPLPPYTSHGLSAPDGSRFDVWLLEAPRPRGRILTCHGYHANRYQVLDLAQGLRARGYEVLLVELRGHGSRPGPCTLGVRESQDAQVALRWAAGRSGGEPLPVGVIGLSMGAAVACLVAARHALVRAVVADSIYSRLFPVLKRSIWQRYHLPAVPWAWITWWAIQLVLRRGLTPLDPVHVAQRLTQPLLAIQGGEDRRVVPLLGREFYQCWAGPKERWFEPQVAHVGMFARHPQAYCDRVASFFDRVFAAETRAG